MKGTLLVRIDGSGVSYYEVFSASQGGSELRVDRARAVDVYGLKAVLEAEARAVTPPAPPCR